MTDRLSITEYTCLMKEPALLWPKNSLLTDGSPAEPVIASACEMDLGSMNEPVWPDGRSD